MFDELKSRMNKFWNDDRTLAQTDPEFVELFSNFAYDEVVNEPGANHPDLDDSTRSMAILAALIGCQGLDDFELMVPVAFESGVSAVQVRAAAHLPCGGQHARGQRREVPDRRRLPVHAVYRLSAHAQRVAVHRRRGGEGVTVGAGRQASSCQCGSCAKERPSGLSIAAMRTLVGSLSIWLAWPNGLHASVMMPCA